MQETRSSENVSTKRRRIAELAKRRPADRLTTLAHHMDEEWLKEAHRRTRKNAAPGVDMQTAEEYESNLDANVKDLLYRAKSGDHYRAPPVRRVEIPKNEHETRSIGIPTHEDKVLQRAIHMILEPVYEQSFLDCSYGFRPGRSPHQAVKAVADQIKSMGGGWVVDLDIRLFFDSVDRSTLQDVLRQRIGDGVILRLIGKWLRAGVMKEGVVEYPEMGTPQGSVVSPILANVLLHEVLDQWFVNDVKPRLRGGAFMVRFADDAVLVFEKREDAERVLEVIPKRLEKHGLEANSGKTRLVDFRKPTQNGGRGGSFDFLGFCFYWGYSRRGHRRVKIKTAKDRQSRSLRRMNHWLKRVRHWKVREQHRALVRKLKGHYAYYAVSDNWDRVNSFRYETMKLWRKWLERRAQRGHHDWKWFLRLLARYPLPLPKLVFSLFT